MSVAGHVVRSAVYSSLSGYSMQVIGLAFGILLARLLAPSEFGAFGLALAIALFFARVRLWGLESLLLARTDPDDLEVSTQFWLAVILGVLALVLAAAAIPVLRWFYSARVIGMVIAIAGISIFENYGAGSTAEIMLARELRFGSLSIINVVTTVMGLSASVVGALLGWGAGALLLGYAVKTISYFAACFAAAPRRPRLMFSSDRARGLLSEGRHMLWGGIGTFLAFKYDDLAVGTLTTTSTLGHYQRAYDLSLIPMSVVGGVMSIAGATYAQVKTDRAALSEAVSFVLDAIALIVLPASVGLVLIAPEAVPLVYGKKWEAAVPMLQLLLLYSMVRPLNDSLGALAPTLNRVHVIARYGIIQSAVMVIACSLLTWIWGAYGAAISAGLTVVVGFVVLYYYLLRGTVDIDYLATFGPPVTASVLGAAAAVAGFLMLTPASLPVTILYKGAIFSFVFGLCLMLLGRQSLLRRMRRLRSALTSGRQPVAS